MALDVKGGLKNTSMSTNKFVVFEELFSNAIDSYLIRKNSESNVPDLLITFEIEFIRCSLLNSDDCDVSIRCTDNGAGFGDNQVKAFITKDSTYKDYLKINGIGKCKGAGRIQFFHYFDNIKIDSIFKAEDANYRRELAISSESREINTNNFSTETIPATSDLSTTITLQNIKNRSNFNAAEQVSENIRGAFSAGSVRDYIYITFLQRMVMLKSIVGNFLFQFSDKDAAGISSKFKITVEDLPEPVSKVNIPLICLHGRPSSKSYLLYITRYSLPEHKFTNIHHEVALCANSAAVLSLTKIFLKTVQDRKTPIKNNFEFLLIESDFLDEKVNVQRDGFGIPKECSMTADISNEMSLEDVIESIESYIYPILTPEGFDREALLDSTQERFGISRKMLESINIKIHYGDTEENIAKRALRKFQEDIVQDTAKIFDIRQELLQLDPRSEDFRERVNDLSWKYTSSIQRMDMANLSQLVVRRTSIIEVLKYSVGLLLNCQQLIDPTQRRQDEKIIHNVFFPTGKNNSNKIDHDIWILNEEYHYFQHIASDVALASIPWDVTQNLFDSDVDESLESLFKKNNKDHKKKRPDIAIFNQEGSAIIIEFKAPGVELQEHIPDLIQYSRLLAAKSNGKIKKFYGYLIGTDMDETRIGGTYTRFPSGLGYFGTDRIADQSTGRQYGELYSEILFYSEFIKRAENRLKVYKEKLNITF